MLKRFGVDNNSSLRFRRHDQLAYTGYQYTILPRSFRDESLKSRSRPPQENGEFCAEDVHRCREGRKPNSPRCLA